MVKRLKCSSCNQDSVDHFCQQLVSVFVYVPNKNQGKRHLFDLRQFDAAWFVTYVILVHAPGVYP
jgi:hypothetical protein